MRSQRYIASGLVGLAILGFVAGIVRTWLPPSANRMASDSYSGTAPGSRAVVETLQALGVRADRYEGVPAGLFAGERRVVLLDPDFGRIEREHDYLARMESWVKGGGQVLVASNSFKRPKEERTPAPWMNDEERPRQKDEFLSRLGLAKLEVADSRAKIEEEEPDPFRIRHVSFSAESFEPYEVRATGSLAALGDRVKQLRLPADKPGYFAGEPVAQADGTLEIAVAPDTWQPLVLDFARGSGRVTVVADPTPFTNLGISQGDNGVLAFLLAEGDGSREILVDEFYHGGFVEGEPTALLGMYPYGVVGVFVLLATLCWAWANGIRFGPPAPAQAPSRRSILEYIEATAWLFRRGGKNGFVLQTCRNGFMAELRTGLFLEQSAPEQVVVARMAHLDPGCAERLGAALDEIDAALEAPGRVTIARLNQVQEKLELCRSPRKANLRPTRREHRGPKSSQTSTVAP